MSLSPEEQNHTERLRLAIADVRGAARLAFQAARTSEELDELARLMDETSRATSVLAMNADKAMDYVDVEQKESTGIGLEKALTKYMQDVVQDSPFSINDVQLWLLERGYRCDEDEIYAELHNVWQKYQRMARILDEPMITLVNLESAGYPSMFAFARVLSDKNQQSTFKPSTKIVADTMQNIGPVEQPIPAEETPQTEPENETVVELSETEKLLADLIEEIVGGKENSDRLVPESELSQRLNSIPAINEKTIATILYKMVMSKRLYVKNIAGELHYCFRPINGTEQTARGQLDDLDLGEFDPVRIRDIIADAIDRQGNGKLIRRSRAGQALYAEGITSSPEAGILLLKELARQDQFGIYMVQQGGMQFSLEPVVQREEQTVRSETKQRSEIVLDTALVSSIIRHFLQPRRHAQQMTPTTDLLSDLKALKIKEALDLDVRGFNAIIRELERRGLLQTDKGSPLSGRRKGLSRAKAQQVFRVGLVNQAQKDELVEALGQNRLQSHINDLLDQETVSLAR